MASRDTCDVSIQYGQDQPFDFQSKLDWYRDFFQGGNLAQFHMDFWHVLGLQGVGRNGHFALFPIMRAVAACEFSDFVHTLPSLLKRL